MRNAWFKIALLSLPLAAVIACSSDDSSSGSKKSGFTGGCSSSGQQCTADRTEYENCLINKCDSQLSSCYGPGYKTGSFSGPCADYLNCTGSCTCGAGYMTCANNCQPKVTADCMNCAQQTDACMTQSGCVDPCNQGGQGGSGQGGSGQGGSGQGGGGIGGSAGGGGGVTCAQLLECCGSLPAGQAQEACKAIAGGGNESNCAQVGANVCK